MPETREAAQVTISEIVAERFRHGLRFQDDDGIFLEDAAVNQGAIVTSHWDRTRLEFPDGSAIVICGEAWDLGYPALQGPRFEWQER